MEENECVVKSHLHLVKNALKSKKNTRNSVKRERNNKKIKKNLLRDRRRGPIGATRALHFLIFCFSLPFFFARLGLAFMENFYWGARTTMLRWAAAAAAAAATTTKNRQRNKN